MKRIRVVQHLGAKKREFEFTRNQAKELGITVNPREPVTVTYIMDGIFTWQDVGESPDLMCEQCGTTQRDLVMHHRAGCENCYTVFAATLDRINRGIITGSIYSGRIPSRLDRYRRLFVQREDIRNSLAVAVEQEDYEAAAQFRDKLKRLDTEGNAQS